MACFKHRRVPLMVFLPRSTRGVCAKPMTVMAVAMVVSDDANDDGTPYPTPTTLLPMKHTPAALPAHAASPQLVPQRWHP
eukprot:9829605-Karenia_brevis.AAC.1